MYLIDTDVISELRKGTRASPGVRKFFADAAREEAALYLSVITLGELRQGVERIRYRGDIAQAAELERWLEKLKSDYRDNILPLEDDAADLWGRLRVPHPENPLDKQIAAIALIYDLIIVTRNIEHFEPTGARLHNPFSA
ncbi:MAG TPA: type II toxin-antitoxin system VapC family toxin [Steroidobacteraceae bacterium]|nr:type II toxin-antitoxin system VapC family toxin [Steroidobacteraceae bacterium]